MKNNLFILMLLLCFMAFADTRPTQPVDLVNPFVGTGGHGHTFPGATVPFGMVQLSPDTRTENWDACSGYHYSDQIILGFSHTHLSGTGCIDYGDIRVMPFTGNIKPEPGSSRDPDSGYCSRFSHGRESAAPGYYSVFLKDYRIRAELTATTRAGFHRYSFPEGKTPSLVVDLLNSISGKNEKIIELELKITGPRTISGMRRSQGWARDHRVFFSMTFSRPITHRKIILNGKFMHTGDTFKGRDIRAFFRFSPDTGPLLVKTGLSAVDAPGAENNLKNEIPHWDFARTRRDARKYWNRALQKIRIQTEDLRQARIFYTALYHTMLAPNTFSDQDGRYRGMDRKIRTGSDAIRYTVFSLWDTFRAAHPLYTIIEPQRTRDFIRTLLAAYSEGKTLPVWELAGNYTGCMIGYHAVSVITDAWVKGIRGYDPDLALRAAAASGMQNRLGLKYYKKKGYIPLHREAESVSKTLEYAYDDFCIAVLARALNNKETAETFMKRALNYRNIFNSASGFMQSRGNGGWKHPFDPREVDFNFTEANAWQYTFFAPHDIEGLAAFMGGTEAMAVRLDRLFSAPAATTGRTQADITGLIGQYAHGNEPSHHIAYLYNYLGRPDKTQKMVARIRSQMYRNTPDGLSGNEDCGQMSAWYVFSALGFYPVCPGNPVYVIGTPLFEQAEIKVNPAAAFTVQAVNLSEKNIFIQSARLNNRPWPYSYIRHSDLVAGGRLVCVMGPEPSPVWGRHPDHFPRSRVKTGDFVLTPVISPPGRGFTGSLKIRINQRGMPGQLRYTLDNTPPLADSPLYRGAFAVNSTTMVRTRLFNGSRAVSPEEQAMFTFISGTWKVSLLNRYSSQYTGGGPGGLIDKIRGPADFRLGSWQGYQETDFAAVVDLGKERAVTKAGAGFLQDQNSWIFFPPRVEIYVSDNKKDFVLLAVIKNTVSPRTEGAILKDFTASFPAVNTRYIKIVARTPGKCPAWHKGVGGGAFIFTDEIIIE